MKRHSGLLCIFILTVVIMATSCSPTKRLQEGEVFLRKQKIEVVDPPKEYRIGEEDLTPVLKQRTNRKILFFRFHLWVHNRINPERQITSKLRRKYRIEKRIQKKLSDQKGLSPKQIAEMRSDTVTFRDWLSETVGEAPVALDSIKLQKSRAQLGVYLMKHGYFNNIVSTEIDTSRNGKKAAVTYFIKPKSAFVIDTIRYKYQDESLKSKTKEIAEKRTVKPGDVFDIEKLDDERERIQEYLNNKGYYTFSKEYVTYLADSTIGNNRVAIDMVIAPLRTNKLVDQDTTIIFQHPKFYIGKIVYHTSYDPTQISYIPRDTLVQDETVFYYDSVMKVKPDLLKYLTTFVSGDVYMKERVTDTYRKLSRLSMFRSVNIQMKERLVGSFKVLDCHVYMTPAAKYAASFEAGVTHRDGLFGLSGSLVARDRNVFKRSENGEFRIVGAIETQQPLTAVNVQGDVQSGVTENLKFNTFEIGPEISVNFNHWFPFGLDRFTKSNEPKSSLTAAFNYQNRPDYERRLYQLKYGLNFVENPSTGSKVFGFADLSTININKSEAFDNLLLTLNDDFLSNSYQNHLIGSLSGVWELNKQKKRKQRTYSYNRISAEMAGLITRLAFNLAHDAGLDRAVPDETGSYTISGIRFAEYLKLDEDFRWYFRFDEKNTTAFRMNGGIGVPLKNLGVLPFEKSYYAGGSNGIRAWDPRTLGPGAFRDSSNQVTFNNVGELKLLASVEYRFKMTDTFEGALFVDAGNIWFLEANESRPNSEFQFNTFLDQIAVGGGLGFRFDFDFFLIRFDVAAQLKDPSKINGERWLWQPKEEYNDYLEEIYPTQSISYRPILNYNLGIGYPF